MGEEMKTNNADSVYFCSHENLCKSKHNAARMFSTLETTQEKLQFWTLLENWEGWALLHKRKECDE